MMNHNETAGPLVPSRISRSISQEDGLFKFRDESFGSSILQKMNESRKDGKFCDVTIHVGQHTFKAHRVVLSAFSQYFEGLLNPNMKEGKQDDIYIADLNGVFVELLVNFAYTSEIEISPDNIQGVLETANFLAVNPVCNACCSYMTKHMNCDNCVDILQLGDNYGLIELKEKAFKFCLRNFYDLAQNQEFDCLDFSLFCDIIKDESLMVVKGGIVPKPSVQEQIIVDAVFHYIRVDTDSRAKHLINFLSVIRLPLVPKEYLGELKDDKLVRENLQCQKVLAKALEMPVCAVTDKNAPFWCKPRLFAGLKFKLSRKFAGNGQVGAPYKYFNDKEVTEKTAHVVGLKMFIRRWDGRPVLGGLIISYSNNVTTEYGNTTLQDYHEFMILEDERIVKAEISHGWMIDQLTFHTNTGKQHGPFGGPGGGFASAKCPEQSCGYLAFLKGSVVRTQDSDGITELQLGWGYYNFEKTGNDSSDTESSSDHDYDYDGYDDYLYSNEEYEQDSNPYLSDPEYDEDENPYIDYENGDVGLLNFQNNMFIPNHDDFPHGYMGHFDHHHNI